jgi:hypothetical protein
MCLLGLGILLSATPAASAPPLPDPVTQRLIALCREERRCIRQQQVGFREFLARLARPNRPSRHRVRQCLSRATSRGGLTDWRKAGRCL